ncbi:MAG: ThiF family adenylyltransferase, partial [Planctomycetales bacterium]|nr:ThiF family adenylyltransferase [Planctomycetales bacterium]
MPNAEKWNYDQAFSRNLGLLTASEQEKLRNARIAIAGMGGVGGVHLITLARLGIGKFTVADPDVFEAANFNRQYGAKIETIGRKKVEVMAAEALAINPQLEIRSLDTAITTENVAQFFEGVDLFVDGIDFFSVSNRRIVFQEARRRGLWAVTAGPHAFGTGWLVFDPAGMSFDEFFDLDDGMSDDEQLIAFCVGCVPSPLHLAYV